MQVHPASVNWVVWAGKDTMNNSLWFGATDSPVTVAQSKCNRSCKPKLSWIEHGHHRDG